MKKIVLLLLTFILLLPVLRLNAGGVYTTGWISMYSNKDTVDKEFQPLAEVLGSLLNSGLGNPLAVDGWLNAGVGFNMTHFEREGIALELSDSLYLPSPYAYVSFSLYDIVAFARAGVVPIDMAQMNGSEAFYFGGGAGYKIRIKEPLSFIPEWVILPSVSFHGGKFDEMDRVQSLGFQLQNSLDLDAVQVYLQLGVSYTAIDSKYALMTNEPYVYESTLFHGTLGLRVLYLFYEYSFLPLESHSFGLTFNF